MTGLAGVTLVIGVDTFPTIKSPFIQLQGFFVISQVILKYCCHIVDCNESVRVVLSKDRPPTIKSTLIPLQGFAVLSFIPKHCGHFVNFLESPRVSRNSVAYVLRQ